MLKALEILERAKVYAEHTSCYPTIEEFNEAIKELEALEYKSCQSCEYYLSLPCPVEEFSITSNELEKYPFSCNRWKARQ